MDNFFKRTWAEINLDAIRHNYTEIKQSLNPDTKICCVVKADGYWVIHRLRKLPDFMK